METIRVNLGPRSYDINIGSGLIPLLGIYLEQLKVGKKVLLVTNTAVRRLFGGMTEQGLAGKGYESVTFEIGDGEEYKTLSTAEKLYDLAFESGLDRRCPVVALGGGVVGDTAGFVAATFLRGVPFVQVPTTLLAQVDSSVGGKVAVNHPKGKNIIGAFYQPSLVLADTDTLKTLPDREISSGMAEVIKYGIIWDSGFFAWLEENMIKLLERDSKALAAAVVQSCRIKARVVEKDETEQGLRAVLNFGHTIGHAVEALTGYKTYNHGEAVGIGMAAAARLAENTGMLSHSDSERIVNLIRQAGLPAALPEGLSPKDLLDRLYRDKKATGGKLAFVLPKCIGKVTIVRDVKERLINNLI